MSNDLETIAEGGHLALRRTRGWEFVTRPNAGGVVAVVAITPDDRVVLVEQHRPPVGGAVIELPAGLVADAADRSDESPITAARRELLEETGFVSDHWVTTPVSLASSAGLTDEVVTVFGATDVRRVADGGGVEDERIDVHLVRCVDLGDWLDRRATEGVMADGRVWAVPLLASRLRLRNP